MCRAAVITRSAWADAKYLLGAHSRLAFPIAPESRATRKLRIAWVWVGAFSISRPFVVSDHGREVDIYWPMPHRREPIRRVTRDPVDTAYSFLSFESDLPETAPRHLSGGSQKWSGQVSQKSLAPIRIALRIGDATAESENAGCYTESEIRAPKSKFRRLSVGVHSRALRGKI
jgi:hypothetical protein